MERMATETYMVNMDGEAEDASWAQLIVVGVPPGGVVTILRREGSTGYSKKNAQPDFADLTFDISEFLNEDFIEVYVRSLEHVPMETSLHVTSGDSYLFATTSKDLMYVRYQIS